MTITNSSNPLKKRELSIDYLKATLLLGMILSHTIGLTYNTPGTIDNLYVDLCRLIIFRAFIFCFGFSYQIVYFKDYANKKKRILKGSVKILLMYYICAGASTLLFYGHNWSVTAESLLSILCFQTIPPLSEFLLAYAGIAIISYIAGPLIIKLIDRPYILLLFTAICFLSPFAIPYQHIPNFLGIFIGSDRFFSFPVLQYFPYFLFGAYLAKNKIVFNKNIFWASVIITAISFIAILLGAPINRFPPDTLWLTLAAFPVYLLFLIFKKLGSIGEPNKTLVSISSNAVIYIVLSNVWLLMMYHFNIRTDSLLAVGFTFGIMTFFIFQVTKTVRN